MTQVCRSWRDALISTPSLWTNINLSNPPRATEFLGRSRNQLLDVFHLPDDDRGGTPLFLSTTLRNIHRLRSLRLFSYSVQLEWILAQFTKSALELKHLAITNDQEYTGREMKLPNTIFEGRLPKLTSLELYDLRTNLQGFNFPSLTRFHFTADAIVPVGDLASFFERCSLLESVKISFIRLSQPPTAPLRKRVRLAALKKLELDQAACTTGLLDHLTLPRRAELILKGLFTGEEFDQFGDFAARIHPSSIGHLLVMTGITKAVAMPNSCILSGPNGDLRVWCIDRTRGDFDAEYFCSFSPIPVLDTRELWVGQRGDSTRGPWRQTADGVFGAFKVLSKVEDLTIVSCETEAFFTVLGSTTDDGILLPGLRRLTIYVGVEDLKVGALVQCAKARKEYFRQIEEVDVVLGRELGANFVQEVESLREFVGELFYRVGEVPNLSYDMENIPGY